jgi:hypothetical protein
MSPRDVVQTSVDGCFTMLTPWQKRSGSWYRSGPDVLVVSNLQRSQCVRAYYLNQSFFIREELDEPFPSYVKGHIRGRVEDLIPAAQELSGLLDLDHDLRDGERRERLRALIVDELLPVLELATTSEGKHQLHARGAFKSSGLRAEAQHFFNADS